MFKQAIVRKPSPSLVRGITSAQLGKPDYKTALEQHNQYIEALQQLGIQVTILDALDPFPDSVFVEDTAVLTEKCAIITRPGANSRKGEEIFMKETLKEFFPQIEEIKSPGTLDGGDVLRTIDHFFIGLSERTNKAGAEQLAEILQNYGYTASFIKIDNSLHLKSDISYLGNNYILATKELIHQKEFKSFNRLTVGHGENDAANCIWVNNIVMIALGYPKTRTTIEATGIRIQELDVSEFRKLDGGLSCLSLRF